MRCWNNLLVETRRRRMTCMLFTVFGLALLSPAYSQNTTVSPQQHQGHRETAPSLTLGQQLVELRGNVARLDAVLEQDHRGTVPVINTQMGMGSWSMGRGKSQGMRRMERKNMGMMGNRGTRTGPLSGSVLPGFPGASHLYHIGATDFFLDHGAHIELTQQQHMALNQIKEQALLSQATFDRQAEQAEQALWVLTSSDQPAIQRIEAPVRQIEKFQGDQRLAFIRAVGKAAKVLTSPQRQRLVGTMPPRQKVQGDEKQ